MPGSRKTLMTCLLALSLFMPSQAAVAESVEQYSDRYSDTQGNSAEYMAVDLIAARPIGFAAMVSGALIFVVSWPFSALGGNTGQAWDTLVVAPADYTFRRPLGDFDRQVIIRDK